MWSSREAAKAQSTQALSPWQRTDTQHFEVHYLTALAPELDRVFRSAERAYDRISGRLDFVLATKVPLVIFAPSGPITREQAMAYGMTNQVVAPRVPHRSRMALPVLESDAQLDALMLHELTHILVGEIIMPGRGGDSGVPGWVREGIADYMAGIWREDDERLMREVVASGNVPALSQLSGDGGFANARLNYALGHVAFDYIERRWGPTSVRRFLNALIVPRVSKTDDAVFDLTPAEFDAAFQQYAERRFGRVVR
jgi:hypothetical protein